MRPDHFSNKLELILRELSTITFDALIEQERENLLYHTHFMVDRSALPLTPDQVKEGMLSDLEQIKQDDHLRQAFDQALLIDHLPIASLKQGLKTELNAVLNEYTSGAVYAEALLFQYNYEPIITTFLFKGGEYSEHETERYIPLGDFIGTLQHRIHFAPWISRLDPLMDHDRFTDFDMKGFRILTRAYYINFYQHLRNAIAEYFKENSFSPAVSNNCRFYIGELDCEQHYLLTV